MAPKSSRKDEEIDFVGLLDSIIADDVDRFKIIMSHAVSPDIYFNTNKYNLPKIISGFPTIVSLTTFFSAVKCSYAIAEMKPKFDKQDKYGRSALHFAAAGGNIDLIKLVAPKPEHYSKFDNHGFHSLSYAAMFNRLEALKYIMQFTDQENNKQALYTAVKFGNLEIVEFLIKELHIPTDIPGIMNAACASGNTEIMDLLNASGIPFDENDEKGIPPFVDAIIHDDVKVLMKLEEKGVDILSDNRPFVPIIEAAACNSEIILNFLLKKGADVNSHNTHGATPLFAALSMRNVGIANKLLDNNSDISQIENILTLTAETGDLNLLQRVVSLVGEDCPELHSKKLLISVLNTGNFEILQFLIEKGLEITDQDSIFFNLAEKCIENESPSTLAMIGIEPLKQKGLFRFVLSKLMQKGATKEMISISEQLLVHEDVNVYCGMAKTEMYFRLLEIDSPELFDLFVKNRKEFDIQKLIRLNRNGTWEKLLNAEKGKPLKLLEYFSKNLMDINELNDDGISILHFAISKNCNLETFKELISLGCDVNLLSTAGTSPLLAACYAKLFNIGYILLEKGSDPNIKGKIGELPSEICSENENGLFLLASILYKGGDVGNSLEIAARKGNWVTVVYLIKSGYAQSSKYSKIISKSLKEGKDTHEIIQILAKQKNSLFDSILSMFNVCK
ncbi:hypothetical protein TVAG_290490 [Trichomonas vaginalis G3]|uniref:Uncharacterized protein n=1 Tax=Trichomonas vaginalis (strain ATCC PRA-98 / G3) TaxID=412133 RepID=A2EQT3_TRIV3|nr:spectrin binding [Trichomonas vaginalis G3]EAY04979.1 hypothetical protein TVAG_290490 [Trichomonas vaginalis G3]KAI5553503.1 spectrin binding [Trichomonas vaginalis G3]|eukprot:XP_001317202.1 hypothetical protein [Trichomonas vaginalis G3]